MKDVYLPSTYFQKDSGTCAQLKLRSKPRKTTNPGIKGYNKKGREISSHIMRTDKESTQSHSDQDKFYKGYL